MKLLFFSDTHLGFDFPIRPRIQRRRRGDDFFKHYGELLALAVGEKVDLVLHGGDMFFRSKIPQPIIQKAYEPLLQVLDAGIDLFIVPGNHERSQLPPTPLFQHPRLYIFDRPRTFTLNRSGQQLALGGFPNIRNDVRGHFNRVLQETGLLNTAADHRILCLHQSIEDAVVGFQNYRFRKGPDVIGREQFPPELDLILCGHLHRAQELESRSGTPIIYPGSIERTSFAERAETKGFVMITLESTGIQREFRPLDTRPMLQLLLKPSLVTKQGLADWLERQIAFLPHEAVVQLKCSRQEQLGLLTASELRILFPPEMNVEMSFPRNAAAFESSGTEYADQDR